MMTPLPAASPDALTTTGAPISDIALYASAKSCARDGSRGRDAGFVHERFRKRLRRFEHRAGARRSEDRESGAPKRVDDAGSERCFRSDERPGDSALPRVLHQRVDVRADRNALRQLGDARISGRRDNLNRRIFRRRRQTSACSRPPEPTTSTFIDCATQS